MTASTPKAVTAFLRGRYRDAGSAARAAAGKAYLKSDLKRTELRRIVDELWSTESYELRSVGIALLSRY
jgi:hypothetical protein